VLQAAIDLATLPGETQKAADRAVDLGASTAPCPRSRCRQPHQRADDEARHLRGFAYAFMRIIARTLASMVGRRMRRRLFRVHHSRESRWCRVLTVSGLTIDRLAGRSLAGVVRTPDSESVIGMS
jgi:hypothetical protein